jgi:exodeoxyribonuclease-3
MKICTWNVNSVKARINNVISFLKNEEIDIALLQETKCIEENFPNMEFEDLGYNIAVLGQKSYNGVAILSKYPIDEVTKHIPNFDDEQARYIEALISLDDKAIRVASVYVPNGNQIGSEKFEYKMNFFDALKTHLMDLSEYDEELIIGGDFNVALNDIDVYDPASLDGTVCYHKDERAKMRAITNNGYIDSYRALNQDKQEYTWWDYRSGAWQYNKGMRIDYMLLNPLCFDKLENVYIATDTRGEKKASDHAPVICEF